MLKTGDRVIVNRVVPNPQARQSEFTFKGDYPKLGWTGTIREPGSFQLSGVVAAETTSASYEWVINWDLPRLGNLIRNWQIKKLAGDWDD